MGKKTSPEKKAKIQARKQHNKDAKQAYEERVQWLKDNADKLCQYGQCCNLATGVKADGRRCCDDHTDEAVKKAREEYLSAMAGINALIGTIDPTGEIWDSVADMERSDRAFASKQAFKNRAINAMRRLG